MRTVAEKYANSSKYYMVDTDLFSTETISDCSRLSNWLYRKQSEIFGLVGPGLYLTNLSTGDLTDEE